MKVWITKYALTQGIIETEIDKQNSAMTYFTNGMYFDTNAIGTYWHDTKESAVKTAGEMRQKKMDSLKRQIEKLEKMRFE